MLFYDYECFRYDWLTCLIDTDTRKEFCIENDPEHLLWLHEHHTNDIWVGYNNKHYDQYIHKGILLGMNPFEVSDFIIEQKRNGWQFSREFSRIPMINYDVMPNPPVGLKILEGFMGVNIKETDVPFNIKRKLTPEEIEKTKKYCFTDVERTYDVFLQTIDRFNSMVSIVKEFNLPASSVRDSEARITARVLGCRRADYGDEFDFEIEPYIQISKYADVVKWFKDKQGNPHNLNHKEYYKQSYTRMVAGIPHTFGFGGVHGADDKPVHYKGAIYHVDADNYYPSYLISHEKLSRSATNDNYHNVYNTRAELKRKQRTTTDPAERKRYKKAQLPYKKILNAASGAMKDKNNPMYDPRSNNTMCINGQLMLLDLIEHLEVIDGFVLIQSNTDGLIVQIPDTDDAFYQMDDICYEWEQRCSTDICPIGLALDCIREIYQKDVNNYLWIDVDGELERKGAYVKELNPLDYNLPIVNEAIVEYLVHHTPVSDTINKCTDFIKFQKIVELSDKYDHVEHNNTAYTYKCYRVFASLDPKDGKLLKVRDTGKKEKFANTPDSCFIYNDNVVEMRTPDKLDKQWYINLARKRLREFGVC